MGETIGDFSTFSHYKNEKQIAGYGSNKFTFMKNAWVVTVHPLSTTHLGRTFYYKIVKFEGVIIF